MTECHRCLSCDINKSKKTTKDDNGKKETITTYICTSCGYRVVEQETGASK